MDQPLETEYCNPEHPEEVKLISCGSSGTEEPPPLIPSASPCNEPIMGELPLWQNSSHLGTVQTSGTPWSLKCDEAPCGNHDMLSTPMGTERTDNQLYQRRVPMFEWLIDETRSEFKWYESVYSSLSDEVLSQRKEIRSLRKQNADLCAENDNLRLENHRTREILRVVQEHAEKAVKWGTNAKPRANGNKIPDCEFKSKWRQLKFNVRMLSAHILDNNPAVTLQARDFATIMKSFRNSKGNELHDSSSFQEFQEPGTRRRVLEAYLWNFISEVVFDSKSRIDAAKTGRTFKRHRKEYAKLKIGDSSQIAAVYDWLQSGWPIAKPVTPDSVNELLRKDCEKIYQMIHGKDGRERSDSRAESREELRDILSLALELDDMIMTSRAMVTVVWPNEIPELNAGIHTAYCESYMELVEGDREPGENVGLTLSVTPILLKKGNARGTNYESQIVLVKGDVVVANGSSQGSAEPVQTQEGTIQ